jgi:hypothetical protein
MLWAARLNTVRAPSATQTSPRPAAQPAVAADVTSTDAWVDDLTCRCCYGWITH